MTDFEVKDGVCIIPEGEKRLDIVHSEIVKS